MRKVDIFQIVRLYFERNNSSYGKDWLTGTRSDN